VHLSDSIYCTYIYIKYFVLSEGRGQESRGEQVTLVRLAGVQDMLYLCKICTCNKRAEARRVQENR
jgi:hypothetical protein